MTKETYLNDLKSRLFYRIPSEELSDIIRDMEECFEAGVLDGKTEDEIAKDLGSAAALARELSARRKIMPSIIIKPILCLTALFVILLLMINTDADMTIPLIFIPPLLLIIYDYPKSIFLSMMKHPVNILPIVSSILLAVSGLFFQSFFKYVFTDNMHEVAGTSVTIFLMIAILSSAILLISSVIYRKKLIAVIISADIIFSVIAVIRLMGLMKQYPHYENILGVTGVAKELFAVLMLSCLCSVIYVISETNALFVAALYPPVFTGVFADKMWRFVSIIDPTDASFDFIKNMNFEIYLYIGLICMVVSFAVIMLIRKRRRSDG